MGKTKDLGHLAHIVAYDGSNHITLPSGITMHTNQLVASQSYVTTALGSYALSSSLGSYVPTSRTITINGTTLDLSANMSFTIAAGLTSFNTRTGAITLSSGDVTTALGFTPYNATNPTGYITGISFANVSAKPTTLSGYGITDAVPSARTITINGTTWDLSANRSFTVTASETDTLATVTARGATTSSIVTFTSTTSDASVIARNDGSGTQWRGRIGHFNATSDRSIWLATYNGNAVVGVHNNALTAWADLYVNTVDGSGGGTVRLPSSTLINGSQAIHAGNIGSQSVSYANSAGSAPAAGGTATALNSSNYINRCGSSGNANTDFQNTPAGSVRHNGDDANLANGPGNVWWFYDNYRHSNGGSYWGTQIAWGWEDNANKLAQRNISGNNFSGWVYYLNSSNYSQYLANSAGINATSGNSGNQIVLRDGNGDIAIGTLNTNHAYFGGGGRGLTSADTYGSYGNVMTYGTGQNGYSGYGIYTAAGYRTFFMAEGANFGIYGQTIGQWAFYYNSGTASYSIGSSSPVAGYTLYLIYGLYTVGLYNASDARMKKNIKPLSSSLDKVKQLRGVSYEYIDKGPDGSKNKGLELGFIAQEVLPVIPELIRYDDKKGYAMNYNGVSAVLVEAIKEQQIQIENQQNQINTLISQLTELLNK